MSFSAKSLSIYDSVNTTKYNESGKNSRKQFSISVQDKKKKLGQDLFLGTNVFQQLETIKVQTATL